MLENNLKNLIKNYQPNQAASDVVQRTKIVLLVGIFGAGKDTVKRRLLEDNEFADIVSYTTRQPRQNAGVLETPGVDYHFIDEAAVNMLEKSRVYRGEIRARHGLWHRREGNSGDRRGGQNRRDRHRCAGRERI